MINPFRKRATEYLRDEEAFLSIVSPEPVSYYLRDGGSEGHLFDRLVVIRGTPGSGKTTLARLFEFPSITALLRNTSLDSYQALLAALNETGAIVDNRPHVLAYRLALDRGYRDFWEFPYADELKSGLMTSLIQARAILGWLRHLRAAGYPLEQIEIIPRDDSHAAAEAIGGREAAQVLERARAVETSIYGITSALVAPTVEALPRDAVGAYRPFNVIERIHVRGPGKPLDLLPLIILDDAHELDTRQFHLMRHWLAGRELHVARWVLTRLDVLHPGEALSMADGDKSTGPQLPGVGLSRDITGILLQGTNRKTSRPMFRGMAKDMADRYLRLMPLFSRKRLFSLASLLNTKPEELAPSRLKELEATVAAAADRLGLPARRVESLRNTVSTYRSGDPEVTSDVRTAMLRILLARYDNRTKRQRSLFESAGEPDPEPRKAVTADAAVFDAARLHLYHAYSRPFYVGMDDVCDAGSENAEQFLHLAALLVEASAARLVQAKPASLSAGEQDKLLREAAAKELEGWNFPHVDEVRLLIQKMAQQCLQISLLENARLGAGANAFGVPQDQMERVWEQDADLASVLQFAVAYNAVLLVPRYGQGNREWCLLEIGGIPSLHYGLTLRRGGFIESSVSELSEMLRGALQ